MKKRTGVERAVIVMAVVVVLLAIALIVVNAAGIRIHKPAQETPVETNLPQFPFSDEPELILGSGQAPSRDAQQAVSVGGEDKTMQLVTGSFSQLVRLVRAARRPGFLAVSGHFRVPEHGDGRQVLLCPRGRREHGRLSGDRLSPGRGCADARGHNPQ